MARPGINIDDVRTAVKTLEEANENVTIMAIRNQLGTGSTTTIHSLLKTIRDEQDEAHIPKHEVPEELKSTSDVMLSKIWEMAESLASSDVELLRKATTAEIELLRNEMSILCESFDTMSIEYEACKQKLKTELVRSADLDKALMQATAAKTALETQYNALISSFSESAKKIESMISAEKDKTAR